MPARRTQQQRSSESRRKLIDAAIELLAVRGYAGTSFAAMGEKAGLSRGLVTHYFGTKEQCIAEVVAHIRDQVLDRLAEARAPRGIAAIDLLFEAYLGEGTSGEHQPRAMYTVFIEALTSSPGLLPAVAENNRQIRVLIERWLAQAVADGDATTADPASDATMIEGILRGVLLQVLVDADSFDRDAIIRSSQRAARAIVGAAAPTPRDH
ncbi:TetR/AcrR family transcriptional regulator [Microbacterium koreense]|uniref:TetR/AcrR family transcriptional regulator n=1 Tax=Microbacterium koreense TaxID=323761 RepID=A0ABW2ZS21_9MICO